MDDIEEEDEEEEELLFCFDLENMFIIYTIITYTLQDQGINHTIYVHVP